MAITPQQFFERNCKWFLFAIIALFLFKTVQSCNRGMKLDISSGQYVHEIDSLKNKYNVYYKFSQDSIKELNYELKLVKGTGTAAKSELERLTSERINSLEKENDYLKRQNNVKDDRIEDLQKTINILEQNKNK
jgi:hypothetical protein